MGKCFCARSQKEKVQSEPVYCIVYNTLGCCTVRKYPHPPPTLQDIQRRYGCVTLNRFAIHKRTDGFNEGMLQGGVRRGMNEAGPGGDGRGGARQRVKGRGGCSQHAAQCSFLTTHRRAFLCCIVCQIMPAITVSSPTWSVSGWISVAVDCATTRAGERTVENANSGSSAPRRTGWTLVSKLLDS